MRKLFYIAKSQKPKAEGGKKQKASITLLAFSFVLFTATLYAQSSEIEKKIKQELWGNAPKEFSVNEVPEKWKNESAVLLAFHREYIGDLTTKVTGLASLTRYYIEKLNYHYKIKLQDKAAVAEFSEISFNAKTIKSNLFGKASAYRVIGIKVIKANGTSKEVDLTQAVKTDATSSRELKIPIPNLEVGDIIDYFIALRDETVSMPDYGDEYLLELKYPVVANLITFSLPHQFNLFYDSYNGAPTFTVTKKDNDVLYSMKDTMRDKTPELMWHSPYQSAPHFRYRITGKDAKPVISREAQDMLMGITYNPSDVGHMADFMEGNFKKTKDTQLITNEIYFLLRNPIYMKAYYDIELGAPLDAPLSQNRFFLLVDKYLEKKKIPHEIVLAPSREVAPWKNLVNMESCEFFIRINTTPAIYLSRPTPFALPGEVPFSYEGGEAVSKFSTNHVVTVSDMTQNNTSTTLKVALNPDDAGQLKIARSIVAKGHNKTPHQYQIFTNYDYMKAYDLPKYQVQKSNLMKGILKDFNKEKAKYEQRLTQDYNERDERIKKDLETQLEAKVIEYKNLNIKNIGMWDTAPNTEYTDEFTLENLTKKAGGNLIVEIGKLIEKQTEVKEDQTKRTRDIYMAFPRSFSHEISFEIPEGYKVEGLENLNKKAENATGGFASSASVLNNVVVIKTKKYYTRSVYDAAEWGQLLPFLKAANEFYTTKILLKKNASNSIGKR